MGQSFWHRKPAAGISEQRKTKQIRSIKMMEKHFLTDMNRTAIDEHPAARAWRRAGQEYADPLSIELLKGKQNKRMVYRLMGIGPQNSNVIAKRCPQNTGKIERFIYEQILPHLPVTVPQYYGYAAEDQEYCWLFMEDVGTELFAPEIEVHRVLAARWLGTMHTLAAGITPAATLPDRGPNHYLKHLKSARNNILDNLGNPALNPPDLPFLRAVAGLCDQVESKWEQVQRVCERMPSTLVHGDFRPKNLRVRRHQTDIVLLPYDWEITGWGIPVADLAPSRRRYQDMQVDLAVYSAVIRDYWGDVDISVIRQMSEVGLLFRRLAAIDWASLDLVYQWPKWPVKDINIYHTELSGALQQFTWLR
jgi:aminoglycoside phosphotransferase (APT) family kinase protein